MWRYYTAADRRDAALTIAMMVIIVVVTMGMFVPLLAAWAATGTIPALSRLLTFWASMSPHAAFGTRLQVVWFWTVLGLGWAGFGAGLVWVLPRVWWAFMPTGTGFSTRAEADSEMSVGAVRKTGQVTRPDLSKKDRSGADPSEFGMPFAKTMWRRPLWLAFENALGVFAPTQSGKSLMLLLNLVLAAPGFTIVTNTKPDLLLLTWLRRRMKGPVWVFDLTGSTHWPRSGRVRWNLIDGCGTLHEAARRAEAMMSANAGKKGGPDAGGGNHQFFVRQGTDVLTALLLAAALANKPLATFVRWCFTDQDQEPVTILAQHPEFRTQWHQLITAQGLVPETYVGVWQSVRDGVACLADAKIVADCTPAEGEEPFNVNDLIAQKATVYVIGSETDAARLAPLITAFVQHLIDTARRAALSQPQERLCPPALAILDELPSICPLPDLPTTLADTAGRGVNVAWSTQGRAQLVTRWGQEGATALIDNTTAKLVMGGISDESTLKWASAMCGHRHDERRSTTSQGRLGTSSVGVSLERVPVIEDAQVRMIRRRRALLIYRHLPPLIVTLLPGWKRPDWNDLTKARTEGRTFRDAPAIPATPDQETPTS